MMTKRNIARSFLLAAAPLASLLAVACGGDDGDAASGKQLKLGEVSIADHGTKDARGKAAARTWLAP